MNASQLEVWEGIFASFAIVLVFIILFYVGITFLQFYREVKERDGYFFFKPRRTLNQKGKEE